MKSPLYTKTGDSGTTALIGGLRRPKDDVRLEAYGTTDELNSWLGLLRAQAPVAIDAAFGDALQSRLFDIGAHLADPTGQMPAGVDVTDIAALEKAIDDVDSTLEPMKCFVLPAGSVAACMAHVARTVCRRAERRVVTLAHAEAVDPLVLRWLNRLSDYLFALSRRLNADAGIHDIPWRKR